MRPDLGKRGDAHRVRYRGKWEKVLPHLVNIITTPYEGGSSYTSSHDLLWLKRPHYEYMKDTRGFKKNDFNPCFNAKVNMQGFQPPYFVNLPARGPGTSYTTIHSYGGFWPKDPLPALSEPQLGDGFVQYMADFSASAHKHFVTAVEARTSLLNFFIEALELLELNLKKWGELVHKLKTAWELFHQLYKKTGSFWLSWNFAIKPTIKDVINYFDSFEDSQKRYQWLKERNHLDTKVKFRRKGRNCPFIATVDCQWTGYDSPTPILPEAYRFFFEFEFEYFEVKPSAWAWVRWDIPDEFLDNPMSVGVVNAIMNGLYNPLAVLWEALPFSWLVDWFLSQKVKLLLAIDSVFSPFKDATMLMEGHSLTGNGRGSIFLVVYDELNEITISREFCGFVGYELYKRQPQLPYGENDSWFRIPHEWYNASILAALMQQKRRR